MNNYIYVEFVANSLVDLGILKHKLKNFPIGEFRLIKQFNPTYLPSLTVISGNIKSDYVTFLTIQDPFLSERMKVSYISESIKDRYRT